MPATTPPRPRPPARPTSISSASTRCACSDRRRAEGEVGPSGHAARRSPMLYVCGSVACATRPTTRTGSIAIASCSPPATLRDALCDPASRRLRAAAPSYDGASAPVTLDDIKSFRQLDSRCTGHPETAGRPASRRPPGRSAKASATSVGMAIAGKWLAATFNRADCTVFDYNVYAMCSDGDIMEGVAAEAASLAGHLAARQAVLDVRRQRITIEGGTALTLHRGRRRAFRELRLEGRCASTTPTISASSRGAYDAFLATDRPADADHRAQPHRLRLAAQAGHARKRTASRWARRKCA